MEEIITKKLNTEHLKTIAYNCRMLHSKLSTNTAPLNNSNHAIIITTAKKEKGKGKKKKVENIILPTIFSEWTTSNDSIVAHTAIYSKEMELYENLQCLCTNIEFENILSLVDYINGRIKVKKHIDFNLSYSRFGIILKSEDYVQEIGKKCNILNTSISAIIKFKFDKIIQSLGKYKHISTTMIKNETSLGQTKQIKDENGAYVPLFDKLSKSNSASVIDTYAKKNSNCQIRHTKHIYSNFIIETLYRQFIVKDFDNSYLKDV